MFFRPLIIGLFGTGVILGTTFQSYAQTMTLTNVAPHSPYGQLDPGNQPNAGGMAAAVATDPYDPDVVYVGSEASGVWKSDNRGRQWRQSSRGIHHGWTVTRFPGRPLGHPDHNPTQSGAASLAARGGRLLYATTVFGLGTGQRYGGLYASTNAGDEWFLASLPGCPAPHIRGVGFTSHFAFVGTSNCGFFVSNETSFSPDRDLRIWTPLAIPVSTSSQRILFATRGGTLFACDGTQLFRMQEQTVNPLLISLGAWSAPLALSRSCEGLTVTPTDVASRALILTKDSGRYDVLDVDFGMTSPTFESLGGPILEGGSGVPGVFAARLAGRNDTGRVGESFDVFVANNFRFYQRAAGAWEELRRIHVDTHAMAFPRSYGLPQDCTAYAVHDGGISVQTFCPNENPAIPSWRMAMLNYNALGTFALAGTWQACEGPRSTCPVTLALPSPDNGLWVMSQPDEWRPNVSAGDNGFATLDPASSRSLLTGRNAQYRYYSDFIRNPTTWENLWSDVAAELPALQGGTFPQGDRNSHIAQVYSLPGHAPGPNGDFVAVVVTASDGDRVVRNTEGIRAGWRLASASGSFQNLEIAQIAVSNGMDGPVVYVRTSRGRIRRGQLRDSAQVSDWPDVSGNTPAWDAAHIIAHPHQDIVYVTDVGGNTIRSGRWSSIDRRMIWRAEEELTRLALRDRFNPGRPPYVFHCDVGILRPDTKLCPLQSARFIDGLWVAALFPSNAIVVSYNNGRDWTELTDIRGMYDLDGITDIGQLLGVVVDTTPVSYVDGGMRHTDIYVGLFGRSVVVLSGLLRSTVRLMVAVRLEDVCGWLPCSPSGGGGFVERLSVRDDGGRSIGELILGPEGTYRGGFSIKAEEGATSRYQIFDGKRLLAAGSYQLTSNDVDAGHVDAPLSWVRTLSVPTIQIRTDAREIKYGKCGQTHPVSVSATLVGEDPPQEVTLRYRIREVAVEEGSSQGYIKIPMVRLGEHYVASMYLNDLAVATLSGKDGTVQFGLVIDGTILSRVQSLKVTPCF